MATRQPPDLSPVHITDAMQGPLGWLFRSRTRPKNQPRAVTFDGRHVRPKCDRFPFFVLAISGARCPDLFFVEPAASITVASTVLPVHTRIPAFA